ncbi:hypothetical protein ACFSR9_12170 [Deinococcus taklimakanensis]|uniref:Uncharacterized protein n=1 Tax=Deinococcus taklimakanensis TaxID=536443 RepID=A0ABW5P6S6_9DEIO
MPVKIQVYGKIAVFTRGCWACDDDVLLAMLEALVDPRAQTEAQEQEHALYAAGRLGGLIATPLGWEVAPHPDAEIRLEDFQPSRKPAPRSGSARSAGGLLGLLRRRR